LLASHRRNCLEKPTNYEDFKEDVAKTDKLIYENFLGRASNNYPYLYSSEVNRLLTSSGLLVRCGIYERGSLYDGDVFEMETIKLLFPPQEITIGDFSITPPMYSLNQKLL